MLTRTCQVLPIYSLGGCFCRMNQSNVETATPAPDWTTLIEIVPEVPEVPWSRKHHLPDQVVDRSQKATSPVVCLGDKDEDEEMEEAF